VSPFFDSILRRFSKRRIVTSMKMNIAFVAVDFFAVAEGACGIERC
jgi:hypothetical protein